MKVALIYPPFCTPSVPPFSITYLGSFLKKNGVNAKCLDLNAKFHSLKFEKYYGRVGRIESAKSRAYSELLEEFFSETKKVYTKNHRAVIDGGEPELFEELLKIILDEKAEVVAFSLVYNSQVFYALKLMEELKRRGVKCVCGGPAVNMKLLEHSTFLKNEIELLNYAGKEKSTDNQVLDFSDYDLKDYLSKEMIFPLRSSRGCFYRQCAFCTHHKNEKYFEIDLEEIKESIVKNGIKNIFFIDDIISKKRLMELAEMLKPLGVKWWCQIKPTKELLGCFKELAESGVRSISFGVESGCQKILDKMRKGTKVEDVKAVLAESHGAGIKNILYIMFGFPGEGEEEFIETIDFLKENGANIDLVSATIFGLQKGSYVFEHPEEFGVYDIEENERSVLDESIEYKVKSGLDSSSAKKMKEKYLKEIRKINKVPKIFNYLKEQILL